MILTIRTDKPEAEIGLFDGQKKVDYQVWQAHKQLSTTILAKISEILVGNNLDASALSGIVVFKGPGSFTGLRIGITVANTYAYSIKIPIVGQENPEWIENGIARLESKESDDLVMPEYGRDAHITVQKK